MKKFLKNEGFTLVELIVVIAILGILAAVAVPAYSGYISKANKSNDDAQISTINLALESAAAMNGTTPAGLTVTMDGNAVDEVKVGDKDITGDYTGFLSGNTVTLKYYSSLTWDDDADVVKGVESNG